MLKKNKRLYYISGNRFPTEKANGIQIANMCNAFSKYVNVQLIVPNRYNMDFENIDPYKYYCIGNSFKISKLFVLDFIYFDRILGGIANYLFIVFYCISLFFFFLIKDRSSLIYTREFYVGFILKLLGYKNINFEEHNWPEGKNVIYKLFLKCYNNIVVISGGLKNKLIGEGFNNVFVSHDGVDLDKFNVKISRDEARKKLGLSNFKTIILYTGHLYDWKGAHTLGECGKLDDNKDNYYIFIGGTDSDIKSFEKQYSSDNILIIGRKDHSEIPYYLKAADILILPNSGKKVISSSYTSPLKLFEYMSSGTPIVASNLPSIRDVLNESTCLFFEADSSIDLKRKINILLENEIKAISLAKKAKKEVEKYSRKTRSVNILGKFGMK